MLSTLSEPGWGFSSYTRLSLAYCSSRPVRISLLSCHFEYRYQPARPISANATRLPIRKYKLRFIQSILQLERALQSGDYTKGECAVLIISDLAVGSGRLGVRVKQRAALQLLQHRVGNPLIGVGLSGNVLQAHRAGIG